ncbi:AAA family ATPase [Candidatus Pelagibacter bacterium nBUS_30]|uniref:AAA family ATPase n=1 Tax=Candidatus Pelagibacter bacterium nBUS_30 TaxID=3374191 RepID=UPI003EBE8C66
MNIDPSKQTKLYGHEDHINSLLKLYKKDYLPNKILFSGEKGVGKSTLAYHLINLILSNDEVGVYDLKNFQINSENKSFRLIQNKSNPNFILVDVNQEKKNIDIGQIRNLILTLNKSSFNTKPRFVLIDNIELLNTNSINALLKILEEPNDNINFILINNNKKILPTLKSRCLNFKISLTFEQSISITNKLLNENLNNFLNKEFITYYSTPGQLLNIINFANINNIDLKNLNLKDLISKIILDRKYKKDLSIKYLIYLLIELYFRNNISIKNIDLINMYNYFLKKINTTKIFNLDEEALFMEFEDKIFNE